MKRHSPAYERSHCYHKNLQHTDPFTESIPMTSRPVPSTRAEGTEIPPLRGTCSLFINILLMSRPHIDAFFSPEVNPSYDSLWAFESG